MSIMGTATILHVDDEISFVKDLREDLVAM
jgi:hypothetical protein